MDAGEICLLLKEQATTQQQHADAFQAQVASLYAELQDTRTLIQSRQGGGDLGSPIPRSMRLDVPKFSGNDPDKNPEPSSLSTPVKVGNNLRATPLPIKWISPAERQDRLSKGLCFNYDNKWVPGHKCPGKFLFLMVDEVEYGAFGRRSGRVDILIDNGSTHNFVQPGVVESMHLPITDHGYTLPGEEAFCMKHVSLHHMRALLELEEIYEVYELYKLDRGAEEKGSSHDVKAHMHQEIEQLLA
ncbi:hypothetical protein Tco_0183316 [Tanacetum coccineum]